MGRDADLVPNTVKVCCAFAFVLLVLGGLSYSYSVTYRVWSLSRGEFFETEYPWRAHAFPLVLAAAFFFCVSIIAWRVVSDVAREGKIHSGG